jgi:carboxyl-terminal processing protease
MKQVDGMRKKSPAVLLRSVTLGIAIGIGAALLFGAGFFVRDLTGILPGSGLASAAGQGDYPLLSEVQNLLDQYYLREQPDFAERQYAAIRGMLTALEDRYTFFIPPTVAQNESDALAGTYGGIGVQVTRNERGEVILYPFQDSPAQAAGIQAGDVLLAVNGEPVSPQSGQDEIDRMLRGEVKDGSGVELTVRTPADTSGEERTQFILFDVINVPSVIWRVLDEDAALGYVQILSFTSRTPEELQTALTELRAADVAALVLDLRSNSGGLLQESIAVADEFLDGAVIVYERNNQQEKTFSAEPGGLATDLPLAILVNGGTASASELVAGALRDNERGPLIGQQTYGKGTVQQIFALSDQSAVHITSAEWLTPDRHQLADNGLVPDIAMIPDVDGRDVELGEAVRHLQQIIAERVL